MYSHTYKHMHIHTHKHTYTHKYIHICIYSHPGVDRMWKFQKKSLNGNMFENSIFYLIKDDYIYI